MLIFLQQRGTQEADIIISERSMKEPRFADKNRTNNAPKSHVSCDFWGHLIASFFLMTDQQFRIKVFWCHSNSDRDQ